MSSAFTIRSRLLWTLILLLTSGCMRPRPWKYVAEDSPWIGPGQQARTKYRKVDAPFLIAAPGWSEYRWEDAHGHGDDQRAFIARAAKFLIDSGETDSWKAREEWIGKERRLQRIPPYHFTIVSLDPTVVLLRPLAGGPKLGRPSHDGVGEGTKIWPGVAEWQGDIEYGTSLPFTEQLLWYSPELKQMPTRVQMDEGSMGIIPLGSGHLLLRREASEWRVTRR